VPSYRGGSRKDGNCHFQEVPAQFEQVICPFLAWFIYKKLAMSLSWSIFPGAVLFILSPITLYIYTLFVHSLYSQSCKDRSLFTFLVGVMGGTNILTFHALPFLVVQRPTSVGSYMNYMLQHVCHHNKEVNFSAKTLFTDRIVVSCLFSFYNTFVPKCNFEPINTTGCQLIKWSSFL
jgi:hypothetical protein